MHSSIGAALTNAPPPVSNVPPAGLANPEATPAVNQTGRSFHQVLAAYDEAPADPVAAEASVEAPAADLSAAQLAALSALLGLVTELVPATIAAADASLPAEAAQPIAVATTLPLDPTTLALGAPVAADPAVPAEAAAEDAAATDEVPPDFSAVLAQFVAGDAPTETAGTRPTAPAITVPAQELPKPDGQLDAQPVTAAATAPKADITAAARSTSETAAPAAATAESLPKAALDQAPAAAPVSTDTSAATLLSHAVATARSFSQPRSERVLAEATTVPTDGAQAVLSSGAVTGHAQPLNLAEPARLSEAQTLNHPALAPETLAALTQGLGRLIKSGDGDMRLQLQPAELGRIELQITHHADGLRVSMVAEVASTAGLLDQHLADLRQSLAQAGINLSSLSVGGGSAQQPSQGGPGGQGAGHQPAFPGSGLQSGLTPALAAVRPGEPAGLVDYWI